MEDNENRNKEIVDKLESLIEVTKNSNRIIEIFTVAVFVLVLLQVYIMFIQTGLDVFKLPSPWVSFAIFTVSVFFAGYLGFGILEHYKKIKSEK